MSRWAREHVGNALELYHQALVADIEYGCFESCLTALGANIDLHELLYTPPSRQNANLFDLLERYGLAAHWIEAVGLDTTVEEIEQLVTDKIPPLHAHYSSGQTTGYLCLEKYAPMQPESGRINHATAILPRHLLPKDLRKRLKKANRFTVIDTNTDGGITHRTPADILEYAQQVRSDGGKFLIAQIKLRQEYALR